MRQTGYFNWYASLFMHLFLRQIVASETLALICISIRQIVPRETHSLSTAVMTQTYACGETD
jgi:hypothetical protein